MGWAAIIAAILQILGPLIDEWLKKCLEKRLEREAADLPAPDTIGTEGVAATALIDAAIESLPRRARVRRNALRALKRMAIEGDKIRTTPLTPAEVSEARDHAGAVENDD